MLDRSQRTNKNEEIVSQAGSRPAVADDDADKQSLADRKARDQLIFDQNLNEVYLLIDFISGRSDRSLSSLSIPNPKGATSETFKAAEIVERIAAMRYPPKMQSGTPEQIPNAEDAALLLLAKDQLSYLARPARSYTIAYTAMFINASRAKRKRMLSQNDRDSRVDLAENTFPGLLIHAHRFALSSIFLVLFVLVWFFVTLLAYWDAGIARTALEQLDRNWKAQVRDARKDPLLLRCPYGTTGNPAGTPTVASGDEQRGSNPTNATNRL